MQSDAVAAHGKGMDQKSINEVCTVFNALSHGVGRKHSSLQEYGVLASPPSPCSRPVLDFVSFISFHFNFFTHTDAHAILRS